MPFKTSYNSGLGVPSFKSPPGPFDNRAIPVGTIVKGYDDVQGEGEFIFLPGVASCVAGDVVVYDLSPGAEAIVRATAAAQTGNGRPIAVSLNDCGAGLFGWFQISGLALTNAIAATVAGPAFLSATAGQVTSVDAANVEIHGARITTAVGTPVAGKSYMTISRPAVETAA